MQQAAKKLTFFTWTFVIVTLGASVLDGLGAQAHQAAFLNAQAAPESLDVQATLTEGAVLQAALGVTAAYGNQALAAQILAHAGHPGSKAHRAAS